MQPSKGCFLGLIFLLSRGLRSPPRTGVPEIIHSMDFQGKVSVTGAHPVPFVPRLHSENAHWLANRSLEVRKQSLEPGNELGRRDPRAPAAPGSPERPRGLAAWGGSRGAGRRGEGPGPPALRAGASPPGQGQPRPRPARSRPREGRCGRAGARAGPGRAGQLGAALSEERDSCPEGLWRRRRRGSAGHEDPVDGAVRAGAAVARGPGRLRRGGALLPRPGPRLLRPRLEAGQGLRDVLLRPSLPPHGGLLLRLRQGMSRWVVGRGWGSAVRQQPKGTGPAAPWEPGTLSPMHPAGPDLLSQPTPDPSVVVSSNTPSRCTQTLHFRFLAPSIQGSPSPLQLGA